MSPLEQAVRNATGQSALARLIGGKVTQAHVWNWLQSGVVPEEYCPAIEAGTGVTVERLRPDVEWERDAKGRVIGYRVSLGAGG